MRRFFCQQLINLDLENFTDIRLVDFIANKQANRQTDGHKA